MMLSTGVKLGYDEFKLFLDAGDSAASHVSPISAAVSLVEFFFLLFAHDWLLI